MAMLVLYARCAGLDVHKKTVVACLMLTAASGKVSREVRTFASTTAGLLALAAWLASQQVTHVAIESTGIFWRPVFNVLEGSFEVILVNAQHMKAVPGHKTDVKDSEWIAELLRHGLLSASFIPPKPIRDLRDLLRSCKTLVQQRAQAITRVQKVLETANIKLSSVGSSVLGKSGRDMLDALLAGVSDAETLAQYARGRLRARLPALREALDGRVDATHRLLRPSAAPSHRLPASRDREDASRDRHPAAALRSADQPPHADPWHWTHSGSHHPGRDGGRHEPLPLRQTSRLVGGSRALYHALEYPWRSQEELERTFLGQWLT